MYLLSFAEKLQSRLLSVLLASRRLGLFFVGRTFTSEMLVATNPGQEMTSHHNRSTPRIRSKSMSFMGKNHSFPNLANFLRGGSAGKENTLAPGKNFANGQTAKRGAFSISPSAEAGENGGLASVLEDEDETTSSGVRRKNSNPITIEKKSEAGTPSYSGAESRDFYRNSGISSSTNSLRGCKSLQSPDGYSVLSGTPGTSAGMLIGSMNSATSLSSLIKAALEDVREDEEATEEVEASSSGNGDSSDLGRLEMAGSTAGSGSLDGDLESLEFNLEQPQEPRAREVEVRVTW